MTAEASGLRIAYRVDEKGYSGKLINYTEHGGFVAAKLLPSVGARVQMAVVGSQESKPVWLDLRVTWVNSEPRGNMRTIGFGGQWLHACSKVSHQHLGDFLSAVLGMQSPEIGVKGSDGKEVHVFDFPKTAPETADPVPSGDPAPEGLTANSEGFKAPETFDNLPIVTDEEIAAATDAEQESLPDEAVAKPKDENRLLSFVKKLSTLGFRRSVVAEHVELDFAGHPRHVVFKVGKKAYSGKVLNVGASWIKLETEDEVPEVWTRIKVEIPMPSGGKRSLPLDIQATVTRIKGLSVKTEDVLKGIELKGIHCKINRVNEKGQLGAFKQYVASFGNPTEAAPAE